MDNWKDYRQRPIVLGAIVLDDQGRSWRVTDNGGYGRENIAQCDGVAYTRGDGVAVRLGLTFLLSSRGDEGAAPESQKAGLELYARWYNRDISPAKSAELKARSWKGAGRCLS